MASVLNYPGSSPRPILRANGTIVARGPTVVPDFCGDRFFGTQGSLLGDPRAGLPFVNFNAGEMLQLQGAATIDWHPGGTGPAGAERLWRVKVERAWRKPFGFPYRSAFGDFAPGTLVTGIW
jgi:hypothetical protein